MNKVDETSSKLVIDKASMEDAGIYTCSCDFDSGHVDQISTQVYVYGTSSPNADCSPLQKHPKLLLCCQMDPHLGRPRPTTSFWRARRAWCLVW